MAGPSDIQDDLSAEREMKSEVHKGTEEDIHAGQSSSPATGAGAVGGSFTPAYEGGDPFLGPDAHVVSGPLSGLAPRLVAGRLPPWASRTGSSSSTSSSRTAAWAAWR